MFLFKVWRNAIARIWHKNQSRYSPKNGLLKKSIAFHCLWQRFSRLTWAIRMSPRLRPTGVQIIEAAIFIPLDGIIHLGKQSSNASTTRSRASSSIW